MRNVAIDDYEDLPVDVLPIGRDYEPGYVLASHAHRRAQVLYGSHGVMTLETHDGSFTVPTNRAVLIPPHVEHELHTIGAVTTWSLYIEPDAVPWWPRTCEVVEVGALLRELLRAAHGLPLNYDVHGRDGAIIRLTMHELQRVSPLPLQISLPPDEPLRGLCRDYLSRPDAAITNHTWARVAAMSTRTLDRRFRDAVGVSPASWRRSARLIAAVRMLRAGTVTETSARLGYASPAAFTAAFTSVFGVPPSRFR